MRYRVFHLDGAQMIKPVALRNQSSRDDFLFGNFTAPPRLAVELDIAANRVLEIFENVFDPTALFFRLIPFVNVVS